MSLQKMSLSSATALVISSQVGSGIFILPASLAALGPISLSGWFFSGLFATLLALIFAKLCTDIPHAGGAPTYVEASFGKIMGFFTAWTYWVVYSISNTAVMVAAVGYLASLKTGITPLQIFALEVTLLSFITLINMRGVVLSAFVELVLTFIKCAPLIFIPLVGLLLFKRENFSVFNPHHLKTVDVLSQASFITLWGFIGLEAATAATGIIRGAYQTAARAVILGTLFVVVLYILNSIGIMAVVPLKILAQSSAPYVDAANAIWGHEINLGVIMAGVAFISCLATFNAGVLAGGQIAYNAAQGKRFPSILATLNRYGAPYVNLGVSFLFIVILLLITLQDDFIEKLKTVINVAIIDYLFIYNLCIISFIKIYKKNKVFVIAAIIPLLFCGWLLINSSVFDLLYACIPVISGIPVYMWNYYKTKNTLIHPIRKIFSNGNGIE